MVAAPEVIHPKWGYQRSPSLSDCLYENASAHVLFVTTVSMCKKNVSIVPVMIMRGCCNQKLCELLKKCKR